MKIPGPIDSFPVLVATDFPDSFNDQDGFGLQQPLVKRLRCAAVGRTGIICSVSAAEVLFTVDAEFSVHRDLIRRNNRRAEPLRSSDVQ